MLKFATTLLVIFSIVFVSTTAPTAAQPQVKREAQTEQKQPENAEKKADLKQVFEKENAKFIADSAQFDPIKTDRENSQQQAQKKGWSTTKKTLVITAIAFGVAALLFVAIKYGKKCLRYSDNCSYDPQTGLEDCPCEEYERRNP